MTPRDRKIVLVAVPLLLVLGYWFLLLSPSRKEAAKAGKELAKQEKKRDAARDQVAQLKGAKASFAGDYAEVVRLGKAVPTSLDMPSLIVQLDQAAKGTGIRFAKIATGDNQSGGASGGSSSSSSSSSPPPSGSSSSSSSGGTPASGSSSASPGSSPRPVDAGGAKAQTGYGSATESANNAAATSNKNTAAAESSGVSPGDTQTSTSTGKGLPIGGGGSSATSGGAKAGQAVPGLDSVPLQLEFDGNFFNLADFFHRLKRFVRVANQRIQVHGRLMTVESMNFSSDPESFPLLKAELSATVYLVPKNEGPTAGATQQGPAGTTVSTGSAPSSSSSSSPTPTATATP